MNDTHFAIYIFIMLLLIASGVAMAAKWVRVPYTLLLVIVGLVISPMHFLPAVHVSPALILLIFLPALLFEAAWNLKLDHLRKNLIPILTLAILGVAVSVGVIGLILHLGLGLSWGTALLFGAMISATDPVSVLALFRKLNLPERLAIIVESESLFNDGTAAVVFRIILGIVIGTTTGSTGSIAGGAIREFVVVVFGGMVVGGLIGLAATTLTRYFDDHLLEISLTTISAYGSFLLAEAIHVSPVIAVLIAGLIIGNYARQTGMSATTQIAVNSFWEYAAFVVNSLVFLLIGLEFSLSSLIHNVAAVAWAVFAVLAARATTVYGLIGLTNRFSARVSGRWQHVMVWGGLRGSLSLALVLSLPTHIPDRSLLITMVFGTVIFSLLGQGLTITPLLNWLKLAKGNSKQDEHEALHGESLLESAAFAALAKLRTEGTITERLYQQVSETLSRSQEELNIHLAELDTPDDDVECDQLARIRQYLLGVRKLRLSELSRGGMITDSTFRRLNQKLDEQLVAVECEFKESADSVRTR